MKKPLIAITCRKEEFNNTLKNYVNSNYIEALNNANAFTIMVDLVNEEEANIIANLADGLLVTGGPDVDPALYNELPSKYIGPYYRKEDEADINLIKAFNKLNKPILGICKGLQIINVTFGGTLIQDIPSEIKDAQKEGHNQYKNIGINGTSHEIKVKENTLLKEILKDETDVNSFHHQAIKDLGEGLIVSAYSLKDDIVEAIENKNENILAVQWHPERLLDKKGQQNIFDVFVSSCIKD